MTGVLSTEMEGSSMQSYLPITTLCGFEMITAVDKTPVLRTFRTEATNVHHLPHDKLSAVVFLIIALIFDIWLVRKHELSFFTFKHFRRFLVFYFVPLSDENENFQWLMSTIGLA